MASKKFKIQCSQCGAHVISYHKEGSGALLRVYLDCIIKPLKMGFQKKETLMESYPLVCPQCNKCIGLPIQNTPRPAWRLIPGSFCKERK